jgi:hypothetical protein
MSMTKRLWSISALAVELNRDRRTIAAALRDVPADGMIGTDKAWHLDTAVAALEGRSSRPAPHAPRESPLSNWVYRLKGWREIYVERPPRQVLTFEETCADWKVDRDTLLTWLRAGLPYVQEGDFETGEGFTFRSTHVFDWLSALICISGSEAEQRKLRIDWVGRGATATTPK